jgi:hypothetical protein
MRDVQYLRGVCGGNSEGNAVVHIRVLILQSVYFGGVTSLVLNLLFHHSSIFVFCWRQGNLVALHTSCVGQKDKLFEPFDLSSAKVCPLGFHMCGQ